MNLQQRPALKQSLKLKQTLTPKIIQMLKTFQLPYNDLLESAKLEVHENVFLEFTKFDGLSKQSSSFSAGSENTADFENFISHSSKVSLNEYLLNQLNLENFKDKESKIAMELIDSIDSRGYISNYNELKIDIQKKHKVQGRKIFDILKTIHTFEPEGVGARDLKECLLIQLHQKNFENPQLESILKKTIQNHLEDIADNNLKAIEKGLSIPSEGIPNIIQFIQTLNPVPGSKFSNEPVEKVVIPSFSFELENSKIKIINYEEKKGFQLGLSPTYQKMLENPDLDSDTQEFLKQKLDRATSFLENIENRRKNLESMTQTLANHQHDFLKNGIEYMKPLLQKSLSRELNLSPSTISRILTSKYVETPHGTFSLKQLCPRGHKGYTAVQIQSIISKLVKTDSTLTDERIQSHLSLHGLDVARRSVAKYRLQAGLEGIYKRNSKTTPKIA
ncbi:RNA polymerase factor sigma-54 [bacterium]|nr:RNA polymerase factor sigma-54 [bacterium]